VDSLFEPFIFELMVCALEKENSGQHEF